MLQARFSPCGRHRLSLALPFGEGPTWVWLMLNPSVAGQAPSSDGLDPTLRRCVAFSAAGGAGALRVFNLFSWVATDPAELWRAADRGEDIAGGDRAHRALVEGLRGAAQVVCGWGVGAAAKARHRPLLDARAAQVRALIAAEGHGFAALRWTQAGYPCHPLYLPAGLQPTLQPTLYRAPPLTLGLHP